VLRLRGAAGVLRGERGRAGPQEEHAADGGGVLWEAADRRVAGGGRPYARQAAGDEEEAGPVSTRGCLFVGMFLIKTNNQFDFKVFI